MSDATQGGRYVPGMIGPNDYIRTDTLTGRWERITEAQWKRLLSPDVRIQHEDYEARRASAQAWAEQARAIGERPQPRDLEAWERVNGRAWRYHEYGLRDELDWLGGVYNLSDIREAIKEAREP